jgi:hypothetical protein
VSGTVLTLLLLFLASVVSEGFSHQDELEAKYQNHRWRPATSVEMVVAWVPCMRRVKVPTSLLTLRMLKRSEKWLKR